MLKLFILKCMIPIFWMAHPLKLTFSKVTFNTNNKIRIETRFFVDDLSEHLMKTYRIENINYASINSNGAKALKNYINERYYLVVNGEKRLLNIDSLKTTEDNITLKVYLSNPAKKSDTITIYNKLLTEVFMNQEHKIIYNKKNYTLNKYTPTLKLN